MKKIIVSVMIFALFLTGCSFNAPQNSPYIEEVISSEVIKSTVIPENVMTFYYIMPDATVEKLHELLCN